MRVDAWLDFNWTAEVWTTQGVLDTEFAFDSNVDVFWRSSGDASILIYCKTPIPLTSQLRSLRTPDGQVAFPVREGLPEAVFRVTHVEPTLDPWGRPMMWEHIGRRL